ncbi:alpha/beta hydrolase [Chitinilyticum piscinae]|uniref:Alpha/beta fold hydrolase n=1 Tax=Chitinilyticum piscinae TaxID=2866724 RepID=A0A8J7FTP8_9NEIS|nr:alpha/beta fold hydrolase [Chitinilyticum piscinae]MBE9610386.1 alpha/beta fold hydrolase [Chitinilyticum piscinae]
MNFLELEWNGIALAGSVQLPPGARKGLLLLHGFTGNRIEYTYFFAELARQLEGRGIATFRFDFPGCGESGGNFADITLAQQAGVTRFLLSELTPRYPQLEWHLLGFSMGGRVALQAATACGGQLQSLVLLAPAMNLADVVAQAHAQGVPLVDGSSDFLGMPIGVPLLEELRANDPLSGVGELDLPVLIVHGEGDLAVPVGSSAALAQALPLVRREIWPLADHTFSRLSWRRELAQRLADWVQQPLG